MLPHCFMLEIYLLWCCLSVAARAYGDGTSQWQISTVLSDNMVVANGGLVHDKDQPHIVYVSSKTQKMIWKVDLQAGVTSVLAGSSTMLYAFQSPRGMCQSPVTGDLLVLDGTGNTALLRTVNVKTGVVLTVLGNQSGTRPVDGSGSSAVLSSGSWWLTCLPDGSAVLADTQTRSWRHICPLGWTQDCGKVAESGGPVPPRPPAPIPPPPAPTPPSDHHYSTAVHWWQIITAAAAGMVVGGAAVGGAGRYVGNKIEALRQKHRAARHSYNNDAGGCDAAGDVRDGGVGTVSSVGSSLQAARPWWPSGAAATARTSLHYEVLPGFRASHEATSMSAAAAAAAAAAANNNRSSTNFTWAADLPDTADDDDHDDVVMMRSAPAGHDLYQGHDQDQDHNCTIMMKKPPSSPAAATSAQSPGGTLAQATSLEVPAAAARPVETPALLPAAAAAGGSVTPGGSSWTLPAAAAASRPYVSTTGSGTLSSVVSRAAAAAATFQAGPDSSSTGSANLITVQTFRKGASSSLQGPGFPLSPHAAAGSGSNGADHIMPPGCYSVEIHDINVYQPLPTGSSTGMTTPRSDISSSRTPPPPAWFDDQQQQRQPLIDHNHPGSVSWPIGDVDAATTTASSVDQMSVRASLDGSDIKSLLGGNSRSQQQ